MTTTGLRLLSSPKNGMPRNATSADQSASGAAIGAFTRDLTEGSLCSFVAPDWPTFERAARRADELGYEHLWTWDHLHAIFGESWAAQFFAFIYLLYLPLALWLAGSVLWFLIGKERRNRIAPRPASQQRAPDDDPAFLGKIGMEQDREKRIRRLEERLAELDDDSNNQKD